MKLIDTPGLGSGAARCEGSSPFIPTKIKIIIMKKLLEDCHPIWIMYPKDSLDAKRNNTLLDTMPNVIYNKVLGVEHIKYEAGFTSDHTQKVFKTKKENLTIN